MVNDDKRDRSRVLRWALLGNGWFSVLSGLAFIAAARPIAAFAEIRYPAIVVVIGASLLLFAGGLFRNALGKRVDPKAATAAVVLDLGWVAGTGVVHVLGLLSREGMWAAWIIAEVVLCFAVAQYIGLRLLQRPYSEEAAKTL